MAFEPGENALSPYRKILLNLSSDLSKNDLEKIKFASKDIAPCGLLETVCSGFMIFDHLEKCGKITPENLSLLEDMLETIGRVDLAWKIKNFSTTTLAMGHFHSSASRQMKINCVSNKEGSFDKKEYHQDINVTDGAVEERNNVVTVKKSDDVQHSPMYQPLDADEKEFHPNTDVTDGVDNDLKDHPTATKSTDDQLQSRVYPPSEASGGQCSRFQVDPSVETAHAQYVNYVALEGYYVEIIGGAHFKTPVGEFVEIRSGCNLNISIDGYDVGGWVLNGGREMRIERPAFEAKKFTFYRVTKAPKGAGIESGRDENGLVKCVFTPEAFLDVPVIVDGVKQLVNIAPDATIGDLKQELSRDLDEVIARNDVVLSNCDRLSIVRKYSGELRLIGGELEITIKTSASKTLTVKVHPGKATIHDLMEHIEEKLGVPIKHQRLYHRLTKLSDAPQRSLPHKLICSSEPTVRVSLPTYIDITIEDLSCGDKCTVKVDEAATLQDLLREMQSFGYMPENEVSFFVNGQELCPSKEKRTLVSLGVRSGSKLELKREKRAPSPNLEEKKGKRTVTVYSAGKTSLRKRLGKFFGRRQRDNESEFRLEEKSTCIPAPEELTSLRGDRSSVPSYPNHSWKAGGTTLQGISIQPSLWAASATKRRGSGSPRGKFAKFKASSATQEVDRSSVPPYPSHSWKAGGTTLQGISIQPPLRTMRAIKTRGSGSPSGKFAKFKASSATQEVHGRREQSRRFLPEADQLWKAGATTLQGHSTQDFVPAEPIQVDPSKKVVLMLRLVARDDETDLIFPKDKCTPLSTLYPPALPE